MEPCAGSVPWLHPSTLQQHGRVRINPSSKPRRKAYFSIPAEVAAGRLASDGHPRAACHAAGSGLGVGGHGGVTSPEGAVLIFKEESQKAENKREGNKSSTPPASFDLGE